MNYSLKWDLESIFAGGSRSQDLLREMARLKNKIDSLGTHKDLKNAAVFLMMVQEVDLMLRECDAYILCLQAQNTQDEQANQLRAEFSELEAKFQIFRNGFEAWVAKLPTADFNALLNDLALTELRFILQECKQRAEQKASPEKEDLITELSVDGYHGWGELYPALVGDVKIVHEGKTLSFGQAENKLSHPDRKVREAIFFNLQNAWKEKEQLFAQVLNHISGFRLKTYAQRGWDDPVQEPLFENRMRRQTLDAMWSVVDQCKKPLVAFLQLKAKLLGVEKLAWYDIEAPVYESDEASFPYEKGASLIIDQFSAFHPKMGEFARRACADKWIEGEDRAGKRPGGFCVALPKSRQSRIFMTYSGSLINLSTLAHELGHAYHNAMVERLPSFAQHYRMNVAETASTFAEQIVSDAFLRACKTKEEKIKILFDRVERSLMFFMNIQARFLFETQFYTQRKKGFLSAEDLCKLMQNAQESAFCNSLSVWHPHFWASKLHFYFTGVPFYNFPYTFGYLFSLGVYEQGKKKGPGFADSYDALLRESGMMSTEDLAKKHLGVDLTKPDFWQEAAGAVLTDIDALFKLLDEPKFQHGSSEGTYQMLQSDRSGSPLG